MVSTQKTLQFNQEEVAAADAAVKAPKPKDGEAEDDDDEEEELDENAKARWRRRPARSATRVSAAPFSRCASPGE